MSSKNIYFEDLAEYDSKLKEQANILQRNKDYSVGTIVNKGNTFFVQIFWKKKNVELFFC